MLRERYRQLLTAYVDGELSSRQRRYVVRLLHRSAEARRLLQQLKADARTLRQLPRPPLLVDLASSVLRLIAERGLTAGQRRFVKAASTTVWMGPLASWAAAAAVLLVLGVASYFYFAASLDQGPRTEIAQKQLEPPHRSPPSALRDPPTPTEESKPQAAKSDAETGESKPQKAENGERKAESRKQRRSKPRPSIPDKPPPAPKEEKALTDRVEMFPLDRVLDLLPAIVKVSDLDRLPARKKLIDELRKDSAFRIEFPCPNGTKAFDSVQNAAQTLHIGFIIGKQAQERIKLKWRSSYALYIENVTPEELTQFVRQIGLEDRKHASRKKNIEAQIDCLVLMRMTVGHHKELSTLLGVDPLAAVPAATGPLGADPRSPLSDATARQVGQVLAGQGGTPRPDAGKTDAKSPEHIALVLAYNSVRPSPGSEEIKHFLEGRKPIRPGALRALLVLRGS